MAYTAVTAVTAQGPDGVASVDLVEGETVSTQISEAFQSNHINAAKIGMLGSDIQVNAVARALHGRKPRHVILDPILYSTSGTAMLDSKGREAMVDKLFPLVDVITPNLEELRQLTGMPIETPDERVFAARKLLGRCNAEAIVVKGGHDDKFPNDVVVRKDSKHVRQVSRVSTEHTRGTGCLLSALITGYLAAGYGLEMALELAGRNLRNALKTPLVPQAGVGYPNLFGRENSILNAESISGIYFVSNAELNPDITHTMGARIALDGGASVVQLREKRGTTSDLVSLAKRSKAIAKERGGLFIVNDRVDVALASDADGVHLGPGDMLAEDAFKVLGPGKVIGVSVSTVEEASLVAEFASYLAVGAIFGSSTKGDAGDPIGVERITEIKSAFPNKKIVAIGGINLSNIASVAAAGADAAAVVSAIVCAPDPEQATRELLAEFNLGKAMWSAAL